MDSAPFRARIRVPWRLFEASWLYSPSRLLLKCETTRSRPDAVRRDASVPSKEDLVTLKS